MAYAFNEDRSKVNVYTEDEIDAMDLANDGDLQDEIANRIAAVSGEKAAREQADADEAAARALADSNEAAARALADSNEAAARTGADATTNARIDQLVAAGTGGIEVRELLWQQAGGVNSGTIDLPVDFDAANYDCLECECGVAYPSWKIVGYQRIPVTGGTLHSAESDGSNDAMFTALALSVSGTVVTCGNAGNASSGDGGSTWGVASASVMVSKIYGIKYAQDCSAEVADIRVGYNGATYASAGDAVRENDLRLYEVIDNLSKQREFMLTDHRHWMNTNLSTSLTPVDPNDNYQAFIKPIVVFPGTRIIVSFTRSGSLDPDPYIVKWDKNGTLIGRVWGTPIDESSEYWDLDDDCYLIGVSFYNRRVLNSEFTLSVGVPNVIGDNIVDFDHISFWVYDTKNLIDESTVDHTMRPGLANNAIIDRSGNYSCTDFIEVVPGETYVFSTKNQATIWQGAYFKEGDFRVIGTTFLDSAEVSFYDPPHGMYMIDGRAAKCFTVPENINAKYVCLTLSDKGADDDYELYEPMLEVGEVNTEYEEFSNKKIIDPVYIKESGSGGGEVNVNDIDLLPRPCYDLSKISSFRDHWIKKDKNLVVVNTGTSLTARTTEHCTDHPDSKTRPPLMDSNNFASHMWDLMKWEGQEYRRYDVPDFFTEFGTFTTAYNVAEWDDNVYRRGMTRYASGNASVTFAVPDDAWQFNFIYRTDTIGSQECTVVIAEGNNKMQVWDGSQWVEANGYQFSMLESTVNLSNIDVPDPTTIDNSAVHLSSYQIGGNTTYQKRLKMRCKGDFGNSIGTTKNVTISSSSGRFMYWGVEWSPREFMITYINAARGSYGITYNDPNLRSLFNVQEHDIWEFKPDLMFTENPIHNSGGGNAPSASFYTSYWDYCTNNFFFNEDSPISLISRAAAHGITGLEWVIFNSSLSWNFGPIDNDGNLKLAANKSGLVVTALDNQMLSNLALKDHESTIIINACKYWCEAGYKMLGDLKSATIGSGKDGSTFTNEGSHWNDTGSAVMARCIESIFDMYN